MKLKTRKCLNCKEIFTKVRPLQSCCGIPCAITHANKLKLARKRTEDRLERVITKKAREAIKTLTELANEAQVYCNRYILIRDADLPCISCGTTKPVQYAAGHYRSRGAAPHLRFNEDNIHKQCNSYCNNHNSGNIIPYRINLVVKMNLSRVEALENNNEIHKWQRDELIAKKEYFKLKIKELKDGESKT